jgi:hypothetical protein
MLATTCKYSKVSFLTNVDLTVLECRPMGPVARAGMARGALSFGDAILIAVP